MCLPLLLGRNWVLSIQRLCFVCGTGARESAEHKQNLYTVYKNCVCSVSDTFLTCLMLPFYIQLYRNTSTSLNLKKIIWQLSEWRLKKKKVSSLSLRTKRTRLSVYELDYRLCILFTLSLTLYFDDGKGKKKNWISKNCYVHQLSSSFSYSCSPPSSTLFSLCE